MVMSFRCDVFCTGKMCQWNYNECASNPCRNGATCIDGIGEFTCECKPGFTGERETTAPSGDWQLPFISLIENMFELVM